MDYKKELEEFLDGKNEIALGEISQKIDELAKDRAEEFLDTVKKDRINPIIELRALELVTQSLGFAMAENLNKESPLIIATLGVGLEDHALCMTALHKLTVELEGDKDE